MAGSRTTTPVAAGRTHPLAYVLAGGLVVGTVDIVFAMTIWDWWADVPGLHVLQTAASGLLGPASFGGGVRTAALGLVLHFTIALVMAMVFYLAARRRPVLWRRPMEAGIVYGFLIYGAMYHVLVPLSPAPPGPSAPHWIALNVVVHVLFIGLPIALFVRQGLLQWRGES